MSQRANRFPSLPLPCRLRRSSRELENAVKGPAAAARRRGWPRSRSPTYTLLIDQYLVNSQYEHAWKRMDALKDLISKERPGSFFARFKKLHEQWAKAVKDYKQAAAAWQSLGAFAGRCARNRCQSLADPLKARGPEVRAASSRAVSSSRSRSQSDQVDEAELSGPWRRRSSPPPQARARPARPKSREQLRRPASGLFDR